jgi:hypothetical protein
LVSDSGAGSVPVGSVGTSDVFVSEVGAVDSFGEVASGLSVFSQPQRAAVMQISIRITKSFFIVVASFGVIISNKVTFVQINEKF